MDTDRNDQTIRLLRERVAPRPEPGCWLGIVVRAFPLARQASDQAPAPATPGAVPDPAPGPGPDPPGPPHPGPQPGQPGPGPGPAPRPEPSPGTPPSPSPGTPSPGTPPSPGPGPAPAPEIPPTRPDVVPSPSPTEVPGGTPVPEIQPGTPVPDISPGSTPMEVPTVTGRGIVTMPVHWLAAGWRPDRSGLYPRLPEFAALASPDADRALAELAVQLPVDARIHLVSPAHVDPALVAEMVLAVDRNLQPWHRDGLREFIEARRSADRLAIRERYTDRDEGFERARRALPMPAEPQGGSRPA